MRTPAAASPRSSAHSTATGSPRSVEKVIGRIGGLDLRLYAAIGDEKFTLSFPALPDGRYTTLSTAAAVNAADVYGSGATPGLGVIRRLEQHLAALPPRVGQLRTDLDGYPGKIARLTEITGQDFPHRDELTRIRARIRELDTELTDRKPATDTAPAQRPDWLTRLDPDGTALVWGPELQQVITDGRTTYDQLVVGDIITPPDKTAGPHRITRIRGYGTRDYQLQPINGAGGDSRTHTRISKKAGTGVTLIARTRDTFPTAATPDPDAPPPADARVERFDADQDRSGHRAAPVDQWHDGSAVTTRPPGDPERKDAPIVGVPVTSPEFPAVTGAAERLHALIPFTVPPDALRRGVRDALPAAENRAAGPAPATGPIIRHGPGGTIVTGTTKDDTTLRDALKHAGFKWSRNQNFWYLPRTMHEHTRTARVSDLRSQLAAHGRGIPTTGHPVQPDEPDADPTVRDPAADSASARVRAREL